MTGGLLQLVALGVEDIYITGQPQITMFKMVYRRHSNFSIYDVTLPAKGRTDFDCSFNVKLDKMGDILHKMYLVVDLPRIYAQQELATNARIQYLLSTVGIEWTYTGNADDIVTETVYLRQIRPLLNNRKDVVNLMSSYYTELVRRANAGFNIPSYAEIQLIIFYIFTSLLDTTNITYATVDDENYAKIQKCLFDGMFALYQDIFTIFSISTVSLTTTLNALDFTTLLYNLYLPQVMEWNWYNPWYDTPQHTLDNHTHATEDAIFYFILKNQTFEILSSNIGVTVESYLDTLITNNYLYTTFLEPQPDPDPTVVNYDYEHTDAYIIYKKYMNTLTTAGTNIITTQAQFYALMQDLINQVNWNIYVNDKSMANIMTLLKNMYYTTTNTTRFRIGYFKRFTKTSGVYTNETTTFNSITKQTGLLDDYLYSILSTEDLTSTTGITYRVRNASGPTAEYYTITKPTTEYSYKFEENYGYVDSFVTDTLLYYIATNIVNYINYYQIWERVIVTGTVMQGRLSNTTINNGNNFYSLFTESLSNFALMNYIPYLTVRDIPFLVNELMGKLSTIVVGLNTYNLTDPLDPVYANFVTLMGNINLVDNDERTAGSLSTTDAAIKYHMYEQTAYDVITNSTELVINDIDYINSVRSTYIGTSTDKYLITNIFRPEGLAYEYSKVVGVPPPIVITNVGSKIYRPQTWICGTFINRFTDIINASGLPADLITALITIVTLMVNSFITSSANLPTYSDYFSRNRIFSYTTQTHSGATYTFTSDISFGLYSDAISSIYHIIQENTITRYNTLLTGSLLSSTIATASGNTAKVIHDYYASEFVGLTSNFYINAVSQIAGFLTACNNVINAVVQIPNPTATDPLTPNVQSYIAVYVQANKNYLRAYQIFITDYLGYAYTSTGGIIEAPVYYFEYFISHNKTPPETTYYMTKTYADHLKYKYVDNLTEPDKSYVAGVIGYATTILQTPIAGGYNIEIFAPMDAYDTTDLTYIQSDLLSIKNNMLLGYNAVLTPPQTNPYSATFTYLQAWYTLYLGQLISVSGVDHEIIELAYLYMVDLCETQGKMSSANMFGDVNKYKFFYGFIDYTNVITYLATLIVSDTDLSFLYPSISSIVANTETLVTEALQAKLNEYSYNLLHITGVGINRERGFRTSEQDVQGVQDIIVSLVYGVTPTFQWVPELGHRLIEKAEIIIGGESIEIHTDELLHLIHMLDKTESQERGYNIMIGNTTEMTSLSSDQRSITKLYIPFQFWFCRNSGNALPLICLLYADVELKIKLRKMSEILFVSPNVENINLIKQPKLKCSVMAQYIYLDDEERVRTAKSKLEYLIERFTYNGDYIIDQSVFLSNTQTFEMRFFLKDSIKYIIWTTKFYEKNPTTLNQYYESYYWNDYSFNTHSTPSFIINNFYDQIKIKFNGRDREAYKEEIFYKYVQSADRYGSSINNGNYMYNFGLIPDVIQPSGTANFSQLDDSVLVCDLDDDIYNVINMGNVYGIVKLWGRGYNILRIMSGLAGLAFTYSQS